MLKSDVATGASWVGVGAGEGLQEKNVANKLRSFSSNESGRRGLRVLCPKRHRLQRHGSVAAAGFYGICAAFRYWLVQGFEQNLRGEMSGGRIPRSLLLQIQRCWAALLP
ncbi:uncharacterized protein LOC110106546 isoform X3 [Dendrobium catenatum]|uniref:uncharacterized protein LOC110106546 isoform X3 n=1 Tax=Dendrobium catenatum TaxID=906689 RepID=UPI0010A01233|nr:uncharacterized protein LOC110106546 isoform X3 [Dendrobium catenatum]